MGLLDKRLSFKPYDYGQAYNFWLEQQLSHWTHMGISLGSDQEDWDKLTESEREVISKTLSGFVQAEVLIEDYWSCKVTRWFKKPEIQMMASSFANMESVHAISYAYLQEQLGMNDFDSFLKEPAAKAKIDRLLAARGKSKEDIAKSLAVFSAFNEGVNLFSSFAILMSFSFRNLLKGVGKIIEYSIRDETLHAKAGCWLFRTFISEYPEVMTDELKEELYEAARVTVQLEDSFIDQAFSLGNIKSLDPKDLKTYIRFRTNTKLKDIGLTSLYRNLNKDQLNNLQWFSLLSAGMVSQDFFAGKDINYSKSLADFSGVRNKLVGVISE